MKRGILSIYWGDEAKLPLQRLCKSIKQFCPNLGHELIKIDADSEDLKNLNQKANMFNLSPFDETLFLDIDTVVMGNLDFGFEKAKKYGLALSICEAPWARRYQALFSGDEIEYNTGVIFFTKKAKPVFDEWKKNAFIVDSSIIGRDANGLWKSSSNDQGSFALALENTSFNPFILPLNWNFRPIWQKSFFGPIKIWHDYSDPPSNLFELNKYYESNDSIIQYHPLN
jgi:hypothetical protein